jgi:hypothetical protein
MDGTTRATGETIFFQHEMPYDPPNHIPND